MTLLEKDYQVIESKYLNINDFILTINGPKKIISIDRYKSKNCFDISFLKEDKLFKNEPNFILSNGIVSHNCKMDVLKLLQLDVLDDATKLIRQRHNPQFNLNSINIEDKDTYKKVIQIGDQIGIFQFEANFIIKMIQNISPRDFTQYTCISALLRPGPLHASMDKVFADRLNNRPYDIKDKDGKVIESNHIWSEKEIPEQIRPILASTLGILVYQEQMSRIAKAIGGYTDYETNKFRKDIVKGGKLYNINPDAKAAVDKHSDKFIAEATKHIGLEAATDLWELIFSMCGYSFNLSHSVAYTYISFYESWLKLYYTIEFYCALFNNTNPKKEKKGSNVISQYILDAQRGTVYRKPIQVKVPSINTSFKQFVIQDDYIIFGLAWIKQISEDVIENIIIERNKSPFIDINDFFTRLATYPKRPTKRDIDALVWSGALDEIDVKMNRFQIHEYIYKNIRKDKKYESFSKGIKDSDENFLINKEYEYINISFKEADLYHTIKEDLKARNISYVDEIETLDKLEDIGKHWYLCKISQLINKKTKTGKDYIQLALRDEMNEVSPIYVWPWKSTNSEELIEGQIISAFIEHEDSNFRNLLDFYIVKDISALDRKALEEAKLKQEVEKALLEEEKKKAAEKKALEEQEIKTLTVKKMIKFIKDLRKQYPDLQLGEKIREIPTEHFVVRDENEENYLFYYNGMGITPKDIRLIKKEKFDNVIVFTKNNVYKYVTKEFTSLVEASPKLDKKKNFPSFTEEYILKEQI
jgi:DNA polymerase III alpha subunit